jgi:hypothetical protein
MSHEPADTLSSHLPSLPPAPRELPPGVAAVFDPRFPIEWTLQSRIWQDTVRAWDGSPSFALEEVARQTEQDTLRKVFPERRFIQPIDAGPAALPPPPLPVVYRELAEDTLTPDWETGPGTAILTMDEEKPRRHRRQPRGPGGQWIAGDAS